MRTSRTTVALSFSLLLFASLAGLSAHAQAPSLLVEYDKYGAPGRATTVRVMSDGSIERIEEGLPQVSSAPVRRTLRAADLATLRTAVAHVRALHFAAPDPSAGGNVSETFKFDGATQVWLPAHAPSAATSLVRLLMRLAPPAPRPDPNAPPPEPAIS